ncbi:basic helix-loop-helix domain-containing protein USF3-like [Patiria miniata]|uniref:BHLH domain-containing protein n=1 Tax=Patiria miniata TaxID=46514 RepID=A0A914AH85_PATMI|nr:basic helix-loop-helix domain-containing protein USF3-like [Patiria miniata]
MDADDIQGHHIDENEVNRRTELITNAAEKYLNGEVTESDNATTVDTVMTQQLLTTTPLEMGLQMHNINPGVAQDRKKRDSHNEIERRRKCKINIGIIKLGDIIPICQTTKMSKNQILEQACLYIDELREKSEKLLLANTSDPEAAEEIKKLRKENEKLRSENKRYQEIIQDMETHPNGAVEQPKSRSRSRKSDSSSSSASSKMAAMQSKPHLTYLPGGPNQVTVAVQGGNQMQSHVVGGGPTTLVGNVQGTQGGMAILQPNPNGAGYILVPAVSKYQSTTVTNQSSVVVTMSGNQQATPSGMVLANQPPQSMAGSQIAVDASATVSQAQTTTGQQQQANISSTQLSTSISDTPTAQSTVVTQAVNTPITTPGNQSTVVLQGGNVQAPGQVQTVRYIVPLVPGAGQASTSQTANQAIMLTLPVRQGQNLPVRIAPSSAAPATRSSQPMILPQPASGGSSVNAQIMQGVDSTPKSKKKSSSKVKNISETETESSRTGSPSVSQTGGQQVNIATPPPGGVTVRLPVAGGGADPGNVIVNQQGQHIMVQKPGQGSAQNVIMPMQISRPVMTQNLVYIQQNGQLIPVILQQQSNPAAVPSGAQTMMQPLQPQQQPQGVNQNFVTMPLSQGNRVLQTNAGGQIIMSGPGFQNALPINAQQGTASNQSGVSLTQHQATPSNLQAGQGEDTSQQGAVLASQGLLVPKQEPMPIQEGNGLGEDSSMLAPLNILTSGQESSDRGQEDMGDYSNDRDNDILAKAAESIFSPNSLSENSPMMNFGDMPGQGPDIKPNIAPQQTISAGGIVTLQSGIQLGRDLPNTFATPLQEVAPPTEEAMETSHRHEKHKSKKKKKKKNKEKDKDKDKEKKKHHHHHHSHSKTTISTDDATPAKSDVSMEGSPIERANMIAESLLQSWMEKTDGTDEKETEAQASAALSSNFSTEALIAGSTSNLPTVSNASSVAVCGSSESTPTNSNNAFTSFPSFSFGSDILSSSMSVSGLPTYIEEEEADYSKNDNEVNSLKALTSLRDSLSTGQPVATSQEGVDSVSSLVPEQTMATSTSNQPGIVSDVPVASSASGFMLDSPTVSQASVTTSDGSGPGFISPIPSIFSLNSSIPESGIQKPESGTSTPVINENEQDPISTQVAHQSGWISHHSKASELARGLQPARSQNQPPSTSGTGAIQLPVTSQTSDTSINQPGSSGLFSPMWLSPSSNMGSKTTSTPQTPSQESPPLHFGRDMSDVASFPTNEAMQNITEATSNLPHDQPPLMDLNKTVLPRHDGLRGLQASSTSESQSPQRPSILDVTPATSGLGNLESPHSSGTIAWHHTSIDRRHKVDSPVGICTRTPEFQNPLQIESRMTPEQNLLQDTLDQGNIRHGSNMRSEISSSQSREGSIENIGLQNLMSLAESTARTSVESSNLMSTPVTSSSGRPIDNSAGKKNQTGKTFSIKTLHRTLTSEITESPKKPSSPTPAVEPPSKVKTAEKTIPPLKIKIPKGKRRSSCQKEQSEQQPDKSETGKVAKVPSTSDMDQIGKRELNPNLIDKYPWLAEGEEDDSNQASAGDFNQSREKHSFSVQNISQSSQRSGRKDSGLVMTFQRKDNKQSAKEKPKTNVDSAPSTTVASSPSIAQVHSLWNPSNNDGYNRPSISKPESCNMPSVYSSRHSDTIASNRSTANLSSSLPVQHSPQVDSQSTDMSPFSVPINRDPNPAVVEKSKAKKPSRRGSNSSSHSIRSSSEPDCSPMQSCISEHSSPSGFHDLQSHNMPSDPQQTQTLQTSNLRNPSQSPVMNLAHQQQQQQQQGSNMHDAKRYAFQQNQGQMFLHNEESRSTSGQPSNSFQNFLQPARGSDFLGQATDPPDPMDFNLNMFDNQKSGSSDPTVMNSSSESRPDSRILPGRQVHSQPVYISQSEMAQVSDPSHDIHNKSAVYTQSNMDHSARFGVSQSQTMHVQQHGQALKRMSNTPTQPSNPAKRANIHHNHHGLSHMQGQDQRQPNVSLDPHHVVSAADTRTSAHQMHQPMVSSHANTMRRTSQNERTLTSAVQSQRQTYETSQSTSRFPEVSKGRKRAQNSEQFFHGLGQGQGIDNSLRHRDSSSQDQNWPGFSTQRSSDSSEPFLPLFSSSSMTQSQNTPASTTTSSSIVASLSPSRRLRGNELPTYLPHLPGPILPSPSQSNKPHQNRNDSDISAPYNAMFGPGRPGSIPMNVGPNFPVFTEHQAPHSFNVSKTAQISGGVSVPPPPFNFNLFNDQHSQPSHVNDPPLGLPTMHLHSNPALPMDDGMASLRGNVGSRHPQSFGNNMGLLSQGATPDGRPFKVGMPMGPHFHSTFGPF